MNIPLTPLDGRYYDRVSGLVPYLSEFALIKHRVQIEVEWLKKFRKTIGKPLEKTIAKDLDKLASEFDQKKAEEIKLIEAEVNHDVKAVEVWLGRHVELKGQAALIPYIHFGRTSEDINNLSYALMLKGARDKVLLPALLDIKQLLTSFAKQEASSIMKSHTHGQPATPTTLGKEIAVFVSRLDSQIAHIQSVSILGKCNGAAGTYAADTIAYPEINWPQEMKQFVESLGLDFNPLTTQIEPHDWTARLNNELSLANTICIDLSRDCWQYISLGYMSQRVIAGEVGSSTMPHKVNPIDFENAESNFGVANALLTHLSAKLPISRLQRDLSDSSALRSLSEAYGHMLLALKSLSTGLSKVAGNSEKMKSDLSEEWALLTEAIQTVMRKNGIEDAYDQMKKLSRGISINQAEIQNFVADLEINETDKERLLELTPETYSGLAAKLAEQ